MRISLNWLRKYVSISASDDELADRLTMAGLEVESIDKIGDKYNNFVIGEVLEIQKHPKADKLTVCEVNIGTELLQIVCGAPNVKKGQKVVVGKIDAIVPHDQHDPDGKPFKLSQVKIRGIDSFGMICSQFELDAGEDKEGIWVLEDSAKVGLPLSNYLGLNDVIFEIGVTPNRPDALSHVGIAREVAAILDVPLVEPEIRFVESSKNTRSYANISIEDDSNCVRYTARVLLGIKVSPSPEWIQKILSAVGIRPINNIADITNYVMLECGQPLHAFDYDKLNSGTIIVKSANEGDIFVTLDHKQRTLCKDVLLICDKKRPIAIAGVIGGENSEIIDSTKNVLIESAYFNPRSIRRTAKYLGISTDASQRFERGTDPNITKWAADRAAQLIQEIAGGEILNSAIDVYTNPIHEKEITLRIKKTNEILGLSLSKDEIINILKKIEILPIENNVKSQDVDLKFKVPTFRPDIEREIDLIEEVARVYGYDNIEVKTSSKINLSESAKKNEYIDQYRQQLIGCDLMEVVTNSMQTISISSIDNIKPVLIANPISKDMEALRTSMIPSMLNVIRNNLFRGSKDLRFFEIGKIYVNYTETGITPKIDNFKERDQIIIGITGYAQPHYWDNKPRFVDIFDLKGIVQTFFQKIFLDNIQFIPYPNSVALSESELYIEINGKYAGKIIKFQKDFLKRYEIEQDVFCTELEVEVLNEYLKHNKKFISLPKFPVVVRDIAIVVDETLELDKIINEINIGGKPMLKKIDLFDIYIGDQISKGKKSCAFTLEFLSEDHTLTQSEIDDVMNKIVNNLENKLNAILRK